MWLPGALLLLAAAGWAVCVRMPGTSRRGPPPAPDEARRALAATLERDVRVLSQEIGERNLHRRAELLAAADAVHVLLEGAGLAVSRHAFETAGHACTNVVAEIAGGASAGEIVVIGAHYDSVVGSPGADDNASGVAVLLALARRLAGSKPARTLRFAAFANEEPPWFQTEGMGSAAYARECRARGERVVAMLSLEALGCFRDEPGSQAYPLPGLSLVYPSSGDFVAFVGNLLSGSLVREAISAFREAGLLPSEGAVLPGWIPGVGWSDQWGFWEAGYPAAMVTCTAPFRNPRYHTASDTPETLDYARLAFVVEGLEAVARKLSRATAPP